MMRALLAWAAALVLPLALLLWAQWPLRDGLSAYSRQANDIAQIVFALYAAVAIAAASRSKSHLAHADTAQPAAKSIAPMRAWGVLACVGPWALFLLWTAVPQMVAAIASRESFSEGLTPGYFVLRIAVVLLAALVLLQAVVDCWFAWRQRRVQA